MCIINKSAHTKKSGNLLYAPHIWLKKDTKKDTKLKVVRNVKKKKRNRTVQSITAMPQSSALATKPGGIS